MEDMDSFLEKMGERVVGEKPYPRDLDRTGASRIPDDYGDLG